MEQSSYHSRLAAAQPSAVAHQAQLEAAAALLPPIAELWPHAAQLAAPPGPAWSRLQPAQVLQVLQERLGHLHHCSVHVALPLALCLRLQHAAFSTAVDVPRLHSRPHQEPSWPATDAIQRSHSAPQPRLALRPQPQLPAAPPLHQHAAPWLRVVQLGEPPGLLVSPPVQPRAALDGGDVLLLMQLTEELPLPGKQSQHPGLNLALLVEKSSPPAVPPPLQVQLLLPSLQP
mmetsp:Transcript_73667/g.140148  ORF Transcript_73667/g.140148 Transcript_73667/m.140148 type:complete len:231 (+) Transcript_73667:895-1587(+)